MPGTTRALRAFTHSLGVLRAATPRFRSRRSPNALCIALFVSWPLLSARSYSRDKPRFGEHLEAIKFLCKEFWSELFKKQVDNLKTNYRVRGRETGGRKQRGSAPARAHRAQR
jgi:hypothetical protein